MDDSLIIKYIKRKNEEGLELLLKEHGGLIKGVVHKHLKNINYYEDECIDDILLSIWDNINSFDCKGSFKSWIAVISKFKAIDYKRKYLKLNSFEDIDNLIISDKSNLVDDIIFKEFKEEVHSILNNLKEKDKKIFIKYYIEDKKVDEISEEMNLAKYQVYNQLSRGRKKLRKILKEIY